MLLLLLLMGLFLFSSFFIIMPNGKWNVVNLQDIMEHLPPPSLVVLNLRFGDGIRLVKMNVHPFHWNVCRVGYTGFATTAWCTCPALSTFFSRLTGMRCNGFITISKTFLLSSPAPPTLVVLDFHLGRYPVSTNVYYFNPNVCRVGYMGFAITAWCTSALWSFSGLTGMRYMGSICILNYFCCLF